MVSLHPIKVILLFSICYLVSCNNDSKAPSQDTSKSDKAATTKNQVEEKSIFQSLAPSQTKITFKNSITETMEFNFVNFLNMYNGGGVSIGDINNDGLEDIFFTGNQVSNKLYLNKGNLAFQDITNSAGVADAAGWTTGTTMVDINNDGLLDIYVCKAGPYKDPNFRKNRFYINQGDNTFKDEAAYYGVDDTAYSSQSYFFDYDKDGDLDMYLVNHRIDFVYTTVFDPKSDKQYEDQTSDKLYKNQNGKFVDVSKSTGIRNKAWGHSAAIYDYDQDGLEDVFVCNDFLQGDNLWINSKAGKFSDKVYDHIDHISQFSMGSDVADINNDGLLDLMVLDMVPEDHVTSKMNMGTMDTEQFRVLRQYGHHYQYMSNMLHLNRGQGVYSEIGNLAQVSKTDWSWAPLMADYNNDGIKEIFITNGIKRDLTSNDGKSKLETRAQQGPMTVEEAQQIIPSRKISNYMYTHNGDCRFRNVSDAWGLGQKLNSNGAAYGDLDNDGDLDLVINNIDDLASIYENKSTNNYLSISLKGPANNIKGIGTRLELKSGGTEQTMEKRSTRGFMSSVSDKIIFGIGDNAGIDQLTIIWPDGKHQTISNPKVNSVLEVDYNSNQGTYTETDNGQLTFSVTKSGVTYEHKENPYDDFRKEILLPHKMSTLGPCLAQSNGNNNATYIYVGGASGQSGQLFELGKNGKFTKKNIPDFKSDKQYEDTGAHFFDIDGDGDYDLYVVSGGSELGESDSAYKDRLYINQDGTFKKSDEHGTGLSTSGKAISVSDYDGDGDMDVFVGGRIVPGKYPLAASSALLENVDGKLQDVTESKLSGLQNIGLVTDALFSDYDGDGDDDLLLTGEWMGLTIFENADGGFSRKDLDDVTGIGWWYSITAGDVDNDGDMDYIMGNLGLNNKFGAKKDKPFHVFCSDFDNSGSLDIVLSKESNEGKLLPVRGRECSSEQMPFISSKFPTFTSFANADLPSILGQDKLDASVHYQADNFASIILINDGSGNFTKKKLPMLAQYGPIMSGHLIDTNGDGHLDFIGAGNINNAEVETVRYDASKGFLLLGQGDGTFSEKADSGLYLKGNIKATEIVSAGNKKYYIAAANDGAVESYILN